MPREATNTRAQVFWKAFKMWAGIMALPGAFLLAPMAGVRLQSPNALPDVALMTVSHVLAPGALFGAVGAGVLALRASPATKIRTLSLGVVTGLACPLLLFGALLVILPKDEASLGWILFGMIFSVTGHLPASWPQQRSCPKTSG